MLKLVKLSGCRDTRQFVDWGLAQTDPTLRQEICVKFFCKQNFERLVQKALNIMGSNQNTWKEALAVTIPPDTCRITGNFYKKHQWF